MTDVSTEVEEIESSAPWPVPEGTRVSDLLIEGLRVLEVAAETLEFEVEVYVDGAPVKRDPEFPVYLHDLASMIDTLERVQDKLKEIRGVVDEAFCRGLPFGTPSVTYADTRPMVPRFGGERVKWANDLLQVDVKPRILGLVDEEGEATGEVKTPQEVLERALSVVSLNGSNAKVGGLRKLGLDPDDYCHKVPKAPAVQVVK